MQPLDYGILSGYFFCLLVMGWRHRRQTASGDDFFLAGRSMHWFPVGISIMTTAFNAINYTGFSGEVFGHGLYVLLCLPVFLFVSMPVTRFIMPFYRRIQVRSVYEFLEHRFSVSVRLLAGGLFMVWRIFWMATALYIPAVFFSVLTGKSPVFLILASGIVVTAYTASGGIRAVMWTDVLQCFVLVGGLFFCVAVVIGQTPGGLGAILQTAARDSLLKPFYPFDPSILSPDPRIRISLWSCWIGTMTAFLSRYGVDQTVVQRYLTARSLKQAQMGFWLNVLVAMGSLVLLAFMGLAMHAHAVQKGLLAQTGATPLKFFAEFIGTLPDGVAGLMAAGLLAASMSSVDSGINSCCTVFVTDFRSRLFPDSTFPEMLENRLVSVAFGLTSTLVALSIGRLGSIFEIANKIINGLGSPLLAIFILGIFSRRANSIGMILGGFTGAAASVVMGFTVTGLALHYYAVIDLLVTMGACYFFSLAASWLLKQPSPLVFRNFRNKEE